MNSDHLLKQRKQIALTAIEKRYGTEDGEYDVTLYVSHHLQEVGDAYWQRHLGKPSPDPHEVISILVLQEDSGDEEFHGAAMMDFTLPDDVTNYVLCVEFDESGGVASIAMES